MITYARRPGKYTWHKTHASYRWMVGGIRGWVFNTVCADVLFVPETRIKELHSTDEPKRAKCGVCWPKESGESRK